MKKSLFFFKKMFYFILFVYENARNKNKKSPALNVILLFVPKISIYIIQKKKFKRKFKIQKNKIEKQIRKYFDSFFEIEKKIQNSKKTF